MPKRKPTTRQRKPATGIVQPYGTLHLSIMIAVV